MLSRIIHIFVAAVLTAHAPFASAQTQRAATNKPFGAWIFMTWPDAMSDSFECVLSYKRDSNIFYNDEDRMVVNYRGRGGVSGYRYRVDSQPASSYKLTERGKSNYVDIPVRDPAFFNGKVLRIKGLTMLESLIDLEIDLTGLKEARAEMASICKLPPIE